MLPLLLAAAVALAGPQDFEFVPTDDDLVRETQARATQLLEHYRRDARYVYMGRIQAVNRIGDDTIPHDEAQVAVEEAFRGRLRTSLVSIRVPVLDDTLETPSRPDQPQPAKAYAPPAVVGHRVLVFVDKDGWILDGDALYVVAGPLAWRSTEAGRFMRPDQDRDWWDQLTPGAEWVRLELTEVRSTFQRRPQRTRRR